MNSINLPMKDETAKTTKPIMSGTNPGLWLDDGSSAVWADACQREISGWLGALAGGPEGVSDLQVHVCAPTQQKAQAAFCDNTDLLGGIACAWNGQTVELKVPMPFHGVFLSQRPDFQRALVSV